MNRCKCGRYASTDKPCACKPLAMALWRVGELVRVYKRNRRIKRNCDALMGKRRWAV